MDVHGTKLVRTLFTIATEWNAVPPNKGMELTVKATRPLQREEQRARRFCLQLIPGVRLQSKGFEKSNMLGWVVPNILARSHRPGYPTELVEQASVADWIEEVRSLGIKSIICFLAVDQLGFYSKLSDGLISYYRELGFKVEHIPARDYQTPPLSEGELARVWEAFKDLPKPVLVHCSAGIDRTGLAIQHIQRQLELTA